MRFMVAVKASEQSEAGIPPSAELMTKMGAFNEEMLRAGVMLSGEGLLPSSRGARLTYNGDKAKVTDGPFAETKELIGGFWIIQCASMSEAIGWLSRAPFGAGAEVEIRQIAEIEDYATMTPEIAANDARLRAQLPKT